MFSFVPISKKIISFGGCRLIFFINCHLLITFATVLTKVRPDKTSGLIWIQTCLTLTVFMKKYFFEKKKMILKKISRLQKSMKNFQGGKKLKKYLSNWYFVIIAWSNNNLNHHPTNISCPENDVCLLCLLHQIQCTPEYIKQGMHPDQTAPREQSDQGP